MQSTSLSCVSRRTRSTRVLSVIRLLYVYRLPYNPHYTSAVYRLP